jgi:hypothetical protein
MPPRPTRRAAADQRSEGRTRDDARALALNRHGPLDRRRFVALIRIVGCVMPRCVNRLIEYLRQHLMIDFQGDLTVGKVRELLAGDDSRDAKTLLAKLVAENSVEDMVIVLADCLLEPVQHALTDEVMREQIRMYSES